MNINNAPQEPKKDTARAIAADAELILIVDDDSNTRWMLCRMLELEGYRTEEATSGQDALNHYAQQQPHLVLVDAVMPGMDGFELCEQLQRLPVAQQVPIIMITALSDNENIDRAFAVGAADYITKPIHWPVLRYRLSRMLAATRAEQQLTEQRNLLRTLIENIPDPIYVKDRNQQFVLRNLAHTQQIDDQIETASGAAAAVNSDPVDQQVLHSGQSVINQESRYIDWQGTIRWRLTTRVPLRDHNGQISGVVGISRDITMRKQTETLMLQREERFRLLLRNSSELITVLSESNTISYQSDSLERLIGYQAETWYGQPLQRFIHPDDWSALRQTLAVIRHSTGALFRLTCRIQDRHGAWRSLEGTGCLLNQTALSGVVINLHDMTEYRQIEATLLTAEAEEHQQRLLAETLRDTAITLANTLDPATVMRYILTSIEQVVPSDAADIMLIEGDSARIVASRGHSAEAEAVFTQWRIPLETFNLQTVMNHYLPLIISNTQTYPAWIFFPETDWIRSYICARIEVHGQIIGFLSLNKREPDFYNESHGERMQAFANQVGLALDNAHLYEQLRLYTSELEVAIDARTAELNQAKEHLQAILDSTNDPILVIRPDGTVREANHSFNQLFGFRTEDTAALSLSQLVTDEFAESVANAHDVAARDGISNRIEIDACRRDGSVFNADITFRPFQHDDHHRPGDAREVVCSIRDMTEHKQVEVELYRLNQLKNEFLSTAAHELRTPLASILGFSELLINRVLDQERSQRYMRIINQQSVHLNKIVDSLLDIARIESKQGLLLEIEPIAMGELVAHVVESFADYLPRHHFQMNGLDDCPPVNGDRLRLTQVLQNLISNAVKYSPDGGPVIIAGSSDDHRLSISVQDTGIGMTPEQQVHLFERFYRADASNTTISGAGLGLAIAKLIVELHGGRIWVQSAYRQGTTLTFTLPLEREDTLPDPQSG